MAANNQNINIDVQQLGRSIANAVANALSTGTIGASASTAGTNAGTNFGQSFMDAAKKDIKRLNEQNTADLKLLQVMVKTGLQGEFAEKARLLQKNRQLTDSELSKLQRSQQVAKNTQAQIELLREAARLELEAREEVEKYTKGWEKTKALLLTIARNPELNQTIFKGLLIKKSVELFKYLNGQVEDFRKGGQSVTQAFHSLGQTLSVNSIILGQDTKGALTGLQDQIGDLNAITKDTVSQTAGMAQAFGVTGDEAGALVGSMSQLPGMTQKAATNMGLMAGRLAVTSGVKPGVVLKDMAKNTENMAKFSAKSGESFMRAAVGAVKMGVEVGKIASAAEGLLDFENSINKQMEASVLLGKVINLDKARELALNGDLSGATQEMLRQLGSEAEFNKMNLLQKKQLAAAMGMSVEDLGKLVKNQDKFTAAQKEALQQGKSLDEVLAMGVGTASQFGKAFNKENLLLFFTAMNSFGGLKGVFSAMGSGFRAVREAGGGIIKGVVGGIKNMFKGDEGDKISNVSNKVGKSGLVGFKRSMQDLATGLKAMGNIQVTKGIGNLAFFGIAGGLAAAAIPFMITMLGGEAIGFGIMALAEGLKSMANGAVLEGVGVLDALVLGVGAGIWMFGLGIKAAGEGIKGLSDAMQKIPFADVAKLGASLLSISNGLTAMSVSGTLALPTILGLTALGTAAPKLSGLGGGGTAKTEEQSDLKKLTNEVEKLVKSIQRPVPITINLDGRKVGEGVYNASSTKSSGGKTI